MLAPHENEFLCRIGPGTPMGHLLRAYWIPLLYSHELADRDGAPRRIRLLGENLVAFRDSSGRVGLLDHRCPHRLASLFFGRNEDDGLRCLYHGWKFDVAGRCTDMPSEPDDYGFKEKVAVTAYRCREANGIIWTYMGPGPLPALPDLGWAQVPAAQKSMLVYQRECNWVQAMEGDFDSSHLSFLHQSFEQHVPTHFAKVDGGDALRAITSIDRQPQFEVVDTPVGVMCGAKRRASATDDYWRVTQFQLPFYTSVPAYSGLNRLKIWVPMDDTHTLVWEANWSTDRELSADEQTGHRGRVGPSGLLPDDGSWLGRGRLAANAGNDYLVDRQRQRQVNFSGMEDVTPVQDAAMQESMGPVVDRSHEHLSASDAPIIRMRKALLQAAQAFQQTPVAPAGAETPGLYRAHGEQLLLPAGQSWQDAYRQLMERSYGSRPVRVSE